MKRFVVAAVAVLAGCRGGTQIISTCTNDSQCPTNFHCAMSGPYTGNCVCSNDNACPQDAGQSFCNSQGLCQTRVGCRSNLDCAPNQFCDSTVGLCTFAPGCGSDRDCPIGTICDPTSKSCIQGCHTNGDCPIDNTPGASLVGHP
jgi:hypothetical protein